MARLLGEGSVGARPHLAQDARPRTPLTPQSGILVSGRLTPRGGGARLGLRLRGQEALPLHLLADQLACPTHRLRPLAGLLLGGLLVVAAQLHLAEDALALQLLLECAKRLVDVVVADENLHRFPR